jgi:tRNA A-37 threonylcarbamoyl transferase component Bud32
MVTGTVAVKRIDHSRYLELLTEAKVLERDGYGEKVLALADGTLIKIFRRKRWLSTALFLPYARRFVRNTRLLAERGVLTVCVVDTTYCPTVGRHLVTYQPLPGATLRQALEDLTSERRRLLLVFAQYVACLHRKGVYFRSLHFGNVIVPPDDGQLGLIDVADLSLHARPLSIRRRVRNFRHMLRYAQDRAALRECGWADFLNCYLAAEVLPARTRQMLLDRLGKML